MSHQLIVDINNLVSTLIGVGLGVGAVMWWLRRQDRKP